ncbi:MAG: phosphatase PAP2 family protein [Collinsella sp.]
MKGLGWFCTVNLAGSTILNQLLKFAIQRPRPDVSLRLVEIGGFSFPSGHSMAAMAFFGLFIWLTWRYVRDRRARVGLTAFLCVMIAAVGFSRVYLGVHYASDVLGGFCASLIWLAVYTKVAGRRSPRRNAWAKAPSATGPVPLIGRSNATFVRCASVRQGGYNRRRE